MAVPVYTTGQVLAASDCNLWFVPLVAIKASDQSVTSSTVLVNDTALLLPLAANASYEVWLEGFWFPVNGSATPGLTFAFTAPAGATFTYSQVTSDGAGKAVVVDLSLAGDTGKLAAASGPFSPLSIHGICVMSSTAGNLQYQFTQNLSSATSTTMKAGSFITARRIA